ncbi:MAG TPA: sigma-70 family RNA polymerase sigma factor [Verrucomicrobiae bacterium]|nr:sigma-70 family RNA polymerase sigma factor [Verrucomicrobiae bacterium]
MAFLHRDKNKQLPRPTATDAELVHAARRGDKRAFVEIVARNQAMVCGIAYAILTDFSASEDAAQDAFLTAWRKIHDLREPERLRSWLGQIARNVALGYLRRERNHAPLEDAPQLVDGSPAPDELAATAEEAALVSDCLTQLPETYRFPLVLYYREGQSVRSVAESLGLSEDAVKQRLARGREMLREQMTGLVESVLKRTAPTAIFTMAVAVAIGALATPAAIATGVFAGATTGSSASAGAASTSFFTAMTTSKGLLVTAAVVAAVSFPIGYHFKVSEPSRAPAVTTTRPEIAAVPTNTPTLIENSALYAEWRKLHEQYGIGKDAMPQLYNAINELKDSFRRRAFRVALLSEWVEVDARGGMAFFMKGHDPSERNEFFQEWLVASPAAAVDGLMASGAGWESIARDSLAEIAKKVPDRIPGIVAQLPAPENLWDKKVLEAFTILGGANLDQARTWALAVTGPNRDQALGGVAAAWAKGDSQAAIAWTKSLPDGVDHAELIRAALIGLAAANPAAALDQIGIVPPGGKQGYFASTTGARVLEAAVRADFDGTVTWLTAHPGQLSRDDIMGMGNALADRLNSDPTGFLNLHANDGSLSVLLPAIDSALLNGATSQQATVWDWLKTQPDNPTVKSLKQEVINAMAHQNPVGAMSLVSDIPATSEGDQQIQELARSLFNGGSMLGRLDTLYSQAPARLQGPMLQTAFSQLRGENLDDPQSWISRLPLLPESARASAAGTVAQAWAQRSPEDAVSWIQSMPADQTRSDAAAAIASVWAARDPQQAEQWVSAMSQGPERDESNRALALALSESSPREAWDAAISIGDTTERDQTAAHVAKMMALRDPATARQWIDSGPFTPDQKTQLQAGLSSSTPSGGN